MTTELTIITNTDLQSASQVYKKNASWLLKYRSKQEKLIAKSNGNEKLSKELDDEMNSFQVSARAALTKMQEERKPFTSKAQEFVKAFTAIENELKDDLSAPIQEIRDRSAAVYAEEAKEEERKQQEKVRKDQERIIKKAEAEDHVRNAYAGMLKADKGALLEAFEGCTEETVDGVEDLLKGIDASFKIDRWDAIKPVVNSHILDQKELDNVILNAKLGKFDKVSQHYKTEINQYAAHLLSLLPARREEIQNGKESELAAEMARKQEQLEADQQAQLEKQKASDKAEELRKAQMDAKIAVESAKAKATTKPIESYSIEVLDRDGWAEIFKFYFGMNTDMDVDSLGKVKLDSMKGWCEKYAKQRGVFIESASITYKEKYKAVARKAVKKKSVKA